MSVLGWIARLFRRSPILEDGECRWREVFGRKVAIEIHAGPRMARLEVDPEAPNHARPYTLQNWYVRAASAAESDDWVLGPPTTDDEMRTLVVRGMEFIEAELRSGTISDLDAST
jgi:hypothetical protein